MKINSLLLTCLLFCQLPLFSQTIGQQKIDSLKKILPSLSDSKRIDCLNELATEYWHLKPNGQRDSSYHYMVISNQEAVESQYEYGEAISLLQLAASAYEVFVRKNTGAS